MATIDVILREKIDTLGAEADVVTVRRGFARNFLIPQGKAYEATQGNLRHIEKLKQARAQREAEEMVEAEKVAQKVRKAKLTLELATGQNGKAFGSVTTTDIAKALTEKTGVEIDRHNFDLEKPIKSTGSFDITVKVHPLVEAVLSLKVKAKDDQGESAGEEA